jgi:flagellum-specific ATP synthase
MTSVASREQVAAARRARQLLARHNKARDLIQLGAYVPGHDDELDLAVRLHPKLTALLQQDMHETATLEDSFGALAAVLAE